MNIHPPPPINALATALGFVVEMLVAQVGRPRARWDLKIVEDRGGGRSSVGGGHIFRYSCIASYALYAFC